MTESTLASQTEVKTEALAPESAEAKKVTPIPQVWLFPGTAQKVFAGWNEAERCFVIGCFVPETIRDIYFWPGAEIAKEIPIPATVLLQHLPIFYGGSLLQKVEITCNCQDCQSWSRHRMSPSVYPKPRTKKIHFGNIWNSQFGIYQLLQKDDRPFLRRLAMGNNKKGSHEIIQSIICWGQAKRPWNLLEANSQFWNCFFSFSYTGKEIRLDNPTGYPEFLKNYKNNSDDVAKGCKDTEIDLVNYLKTLDPVIVSSQPRDGVCLNYRGFPRKKPQINWADRDSDGTWFINEKLEPKVKIQSSVIV